MRSMHRTLSVQKVIERKHNNGISGKEELYNWTEIYLIPQVEKNANRYIYFWKDRVQNI